MKKDYPLISVLVCNYNYAEYIEEALDSVFKQTYRNIELIIIDDGSKDNSTKIIRSYIKNHPDKKIVFKDMPQNQGVCYSRNNAINLAKGKYFIFLDSDDVMPPNYVQDYYKLAEEQGADVVYGDMISFGTEGDKTSFPSFDLKKLLIHNYINISSLVKTSSLKDHEFDINLNRRSHEDYDFWLGLALSGAKFIKSNKSILNYRVHQQSRNFSILSYGERMLKFIDVWQYSVVKYRKTYPGKLNDDLEFKQLDYCIKELNRELIKLNEHLHKDVLPELQKKQDHIAYLEKEIARQDDEISYLNKNIDLLHNSLNYKVGAKVLAPARYVRKRLSLPN